MEFTAQEQADLAAHKEILSELLRTADEFLPQHPEQELCPRQAALLERLEAAFAGLSCPPWHQPAERRTGGGRLARAPRGGIHQRHR